MRLLLPSARAALGARAAFPMARHSMGGSIGRVLLMSASAGAKPSRSVVVAPLASPLGEKFSVHQPVAQRAMRYLDASPDPFHATEQTCLRLVEAGYERLDERDAWAGKLLPSGKYFFTRNRSCVVAFAVGAKYMPGNGFKVIGAHTDSPNLRIKPRSKRGAASLTQLDVECYGGGLWVRVEGLELPISGP